MAVASNHLQTVMFDPLSYIHPACFTLPALFDNTTQHAIINRMLLDHYQLSSHLPVITPGSVDYVLVKHWSQLPQLAYLLACQRFRVALARGGKLLSLPNWARSFAMLPLPQCDNAPTPTGALDTTALLGHGLTDLLAYCRGMAPALQQRIPLLFPPVVKTLEIAPPSPLPPATMMERGDILFTLALQHVKKFPGKTTLPRG